MPEKKYLYIVEPDDRILFSSLIQAATSKTRLQIQQAGWKLAVEQYGIADNDKSKLPQLPRWITDAVLREDPRFYRDDSEPTFILLPTRRIIRQEPISQFFRTFRPDSRNHWYKSFYDGIGLTYGTEVVDYYVGVPPEEQDQPINPSLN